MIIPPGLHIVGTPIGNLDDITLRALQTLREASLVLAEDTRHTSILFARHELRRPLASCHKFNEASRLDEVAARIAAGEIIALVSDSGMPGISDPGSRVVRGCRERGLPVWVVPGPSAVVSAVSLSGWGDEGFTFAGFLPTGPGSRKNALRALSTERRAVVVYESPHRIARLLADIAEILGDRPVMVARELTKKFEESPAGTAAALLAAHGDRPWKGEIAVVIHPAPKHFTPPPAAGGADGNDATDATECSPEPQPH